jgi:nuclear transport factor 2 (NTF2) superfamily protein
MAEDLWNTRDPERVALAYNVTCTHTEPAPWGQVSQHLAA